MNNSKILITGGLGFIGNEVVRQLKLTSNEIFILDNRNRIAPDISDILDVKQLIIDITNKTEIFEAFSLIKPDYVIHLAAIHFIPECNDNPTRTLDVNVIGTQNILEASKKNRIKGFIMASSGAIYADSESLLTENESKIEPVDIYGLSKLFCENISNLYRNDFPITLVRLFNVYGPRETNPHIIPEIINQLKFSNTLTLGNIDTFRDFIHVEDVAKNFIELVSNNLRGFNIVNLGTSKAHSIRELIMIFSEKTNRDIKINIDPKRFRVSDKRVQKANISRLKNLNPKLKLMSFSKGLSNLLRYEKINEK
jgi:UDP-glucose 4-epimerase